MIYFLQSQATGKIKIGTSKYPLDRITDIRHLKKEKMALLALEEGAHKREHFLHRCFAESRAEGEWFYPSHAILEHIEAVNVKSGEATRKAVSDWAAARKAPAFDPTALNDVIAQHGGQSKFAEKIGISRQSLNRIVRGRAKLGPGIALKVYFATGARLGVLEGTGKGNG